MRAIPILFTPLPVNAPLKNKLKANNQPKSDTKPLPPAAHPVKSRSAKTEMAIDNLPPSLQMLSDENPAFAHALKIDLAGITNAAYDYDSDSDSDDDEYESEGLRFKRYTDKMRGSELGKEAYRFVADQDEDEDSQDGADQDSGYIPTIWQEDGEIKSAPPNNAVGEDALGDLSAAYRVRLNGKSPVNLKDTDEPVLADQKMIWSTDCEQDFVFTFQFDQDVIETPDLSTAVSSCSLNPLETPPDSPIISQRIRGESAGKK